MNRYFFAGRLVENGMKQDVALSLFFNTVLKQPTEQAQNVLAQGILDVFAPTPIAGPTVFTSNGDAWCRWCNCFANECLCANKWYEDSYSGDDPPEAYV